MTLQKNDALVPLGRIGHAAKSIIYLAIGLLTASTALDGGRTQSSRDVLHALARQPFGEILLGILLGGIACYVLWRTILVFAPATEHGAKAWAVRFGSLLSGAAYGGLGLAAFRLLTSGASSGDGESSARSGTAELMAAPFGKWLVVAVGLGLLGYAVGQWHRAWTHSFTKSLALGPLAARTRQVVTRVSATGIAARGVAFALAGIFLTQAGLQANPSKARGLAGSLDALRSQPYGSWLLALTALGLAGYGMYCALKSRYGRMRG